MGASAVPTRWLFALTLRQFRKAHPRGVEAKTPLQVWHSIVKAAEVLSRKPGLDLGALREGQKARRKRQLAMYGWAGFQPIVMDIGPEVEHVSLRADARMVFSGSTVSD